MSTYSDLVVADGPAAYWRFGEAAGTDAAPLVGASHGTYVSCTVGQSGLLPADPAAKCVYLNGTSSFISMPGGCGISGAPLTVEFWVKPNAATLIGAFDSAPGEMNVIRNYGANQFEWWNANPSYSYAFSSGVLYHVVVVFKIVGSYRHLLLYVNGALIADTPGTSGSGATITTWRFGNINNGASGIMKGWLQDVALYAKELTLSQVQAHFAAASVRAVAVRQTLAFDVLGGLMARQDLPLTIDGRIWQHEAICALEILGMPNTIIQLLVDVSPGWLQAQEHLPFGSAGWLYLLEKTPVEVIGEDGIVHTWSALQVATGQLPHSWRVLGTLQRSEILHRWTVMTEEGGSFPHLWRTIQPQLVALRGQNVQLPYGHLEKT